MSGNGARLGVPSQVVSSAEATLPLHERYTILNVENYTKWKASFDGGCNVYDLDEKWKLRNFLGYIDADTQEDVKSIAYYVEPPNEPATDFSTRSELFWQAMERNLRIILDVGESGEKFLCGATDQDPEFLELIARRIISIGGDNKKPEGGISKPAQIEPENEKITSKSITIQEDSDDSEWYESKTETPVKPFQRRAPIQTNENIEEAYRRIRESEIPLRMEQILAILDDKCEQIHRGCSKKKDGLVVTEK
ncbi:hypothetical protein HK098_003216 [Nowakowskiella sp. JEL0407]|nr:hypothetical protein HK098_003216 [Nowakowskiella sp. JEL0407]